jgi:hypothetical protein
VKGMCTVVAFGALEPGYVFHVSPGQGCTPRRQSPANC